MSTCVINEAGEVVGIRFFGGASKGALADVNMPASVAKSVGSMVVFEEPTPDYRTTLSEWIKDMETQGRTVRYGGASAVRT